MINIRNLLHRGGLLAAWQPLPSGSFVQTQNLIQPKNVFRTTVHPFGPTCLPSYSIIKLFKSSDAKKGSLDDKRVKRHYTPEEDKQLLEHVNTHGKGPKSYKHIAETLDRSYNSVYDRCKLLLSDNEYDGNSDQKQWSYEEDEKLVRFVFDHKEIKPGNFFARNGCKRK